MKKRNVKKMELAKETVRMLDLGDVRGGANNQYTVPEGSCSCHTDPLSSVC